jgi:hypothetical protein
VLHIFSTAPTAPYFVRVRANDIPCVVDVPSKLPFANLCVMHYVKYLNEENYWVLNQAGVGTVTAPCFVNRVAQIALKRDDGTNTCGQVTIQVPMDGTLSNLPQSTCIYACTNDCQNTCGKIVSRATEWYKHLQPISPEIKRIHVPVLPCFVSKLPGFFFMVKHPEDYESERFFTNALQIAANRRMMSRGALDELTERVWSTRQQTVASEDFMKLATVVVEALSIAPNMMPYNADVELNCTTGYKPMERFSSDSRVNQTGDCEDQAREILNLARSLQCGSYSTSLVRVAQYVCRCYLATQQFGAVALGADPSLKVYSTGGNLFAHSFVIFIPASFVAASVVDAKLEDYMDSHHQSGVQVLTTDGIALFDPNPLSPTHTCIASKLNSLNDLNADRTFANKLKCYSRIGNHYYMFLCSAFVLNGLRNQLGVPVFEIYVSNKSGFYGCTFEEMLHKSPQLKLVSSYTLTPEEHAMAKQCTAVFHPVPPYTDGNEASVAAFKALQTNLNEAGVQMVNTRTSKDQRLITTFLTSNNLGDASFMEALRTSLQGKRVQLTPEDLSAELYGVKLEIYLPAI